MTLRSNPRTAARNHGRWINRLSPVPRQLHPLCFLIVTLLSACSTTGEVVRWEPAPGVEITPASETIPIVVMERACSGGDTAAGRIQHPDVESRADAVVVTVRITPKPGFQNCPGNPPTCYNLDLTEPVGSRPLLMGGFDEPQIPGVDGLIGPVNCLN